MRALLVRYGFLAAFTAVLVGLASSLLLGDANPWTVWNLEREKAEVSAEWAAVERENDRMLREIRALRSDPRVYERLAADRHNVAPEGAVIYAFDEPEPSQVPEGEAP